MSLLARVLLGSAPREPKTEGCKSSGPQAGCATYSYNLQESGDLFPSNLMKSKANTEILSSNASEVLVYMVHGTFSSAEAFSSATEGLRKMISESLPNSVTAEFLYLDWSSRLFKLNNSHYQRTLAADRLAEKCHSDFDKHNPKSIVFLGHSHGGNVCVYAYERLSPMLKDKVVGIVCLSTPFITATPKAEPRYRVWRFLIVNPIGFGSVGVTIAGLSLLAAVWVGIPKVIPTFFVVMPDAFLIALASGLWSIMNHVNDSEIQRLLGSCSLNEEKLFVASTAFDEAAFWLTAFDLGERLVLLALNLRALLLVATAVSIASLGLNIDNETSTWAAVTKCVVSGLLAAISLFYSSTFLSVVASALRSTAIGLGGFSLENQFHFTIKVRKAPPGVNTYTAFIVENGKGLVHSRLYQDEQVSLAVTQWLLRRLFNRTDTRDALFSKPGEG